MTAFDPNTVVDGRYRIVSRLGSGSMGIVFRGEDIWLGRPVAIKIVDPAQSDAAAAKSFVQEARSLAQIRHDNVVNVYAFGTHAGLYYFAMEYIAGQTLDVIIEDNWSRGTTVELKRALEIIRAIGRGLTAVHSRNLVHRDVKPGNVVIEETTNRPVLVDFGLARRGKTSNPRMTTTAGTPSYMPPEQARDTDGTKTTAASDLYAFACTAFELLTGRPVFEGADVYEVLRAHLGDPPPTISMLRPDLGMFDAAFARALAKSPEYRHESVLAFLDELDVAYKRETTSIPPRSARPRSRPSKADAIRVFMLETDEALARQLTRAADRALDVPALEIFTASSDLVAAFDRAPARIVILDEDASASPISSVVFALRQLPGGGDTQIIVLSRQWDGKPSGLSELGVRELPKPFNTHVVESVLRKAATSSLPPP